MNLDLSALQCTPSKEDKRYFIDTHVLRSTAQGGLKNWFIRTEYEFFSDSYFKTSVALAVFARDNKLLYERGRIETSDREGMLFHAPNNGRYMERVTDGVLEYGRIESWPTAARNKSLMWGYVAFGLDRQLPNMVLDNRRNNSKVFGSNLPYSLAANQRLALEGNFNDYFDLYVPTGYERDALYVFNPDIMQRMISASAMCDAEVIGDKVIFYLPNSRIDDSMVRLAYDLKEALQQKVDTVASRYRDERLAESPVANQNQISDHGARLKRSLVTKLSSAIGIATIIVWMLLGMPR